MIEQAEARLSYAQRLANLKRREAAVIRASKPAHAELYYFDFVDNDLGNWVRVYHATLRAAQADRRKMILEYGYHATGEPTGERDEVTRVQSCVVELTPAGVLSALQNSDPNA